MTDGKVYSYNPEENELLYGLETVCKFNSKNIVDLLNELSEEIMSLRWENTKLKLVLKDIVEDLETEAERKVPIIIQKEYVDWVKSNVNLRLNSSKLNRPGDE